MPPQQPDRLLDLFNKAFDFRTHIFFRANNVTLLRRRDFVPQDLDGERH
jgi:hypothetical protein